MTVVGAGPVGSLLAIVLARRGYNVDMFERRPRLSAASGRSINLALSARGLHALQCVGLREAVLEQAVPMFGRMLHAPSGETQFQPYGAADACIYSVSRAALNQRLLTAAQDTGAVRVHFEQRLRAYDNGVLYFDAPHTPIGPVFGTDGSASVMRQAIGHTTHNTLSHAYKELTLPAGSGLAPQALHIWPRQRHMLIALPNFDGSFTCTFFYPHEDLVQMRHPKGFFAKAFGDVQINDLEDQFFANPTGSLVTIKTWPWHQGNALLLGDAAHAIVPFFGQGLNAGFEDCMILDGLLEQPNAFAAFAAMRKPDADAIADMALDNFIEMCARVAEPRFLLQKQVELLLQREFPRLYQSRYHLVTFSRVPYSVAARVGVVQAEILTELCQGLAKAADVDLHRARTLIGNKLECFTAYF